MKSIYIITPITRKCREWLKKNVQIEDSFDYSPSIYVETRYVGDIVLAMIDSGFVREQDFYLA